ncbi:MAG: hypothetical protein HQL67_01830 [Magnetococcales bacterium]|nr:hypothetical protein [Magnetococcales bacterium]
MNRTRYALPGIVRRLGHVGPALLLLMFTLFWSTPALTAEQPNAQAVTTTDTSVEAKLNDIKKDLEKRQAEFNSKTTELQKAKTAQEKKSLESELIALNKLIDEQQTSFEMIVTGGLEQALVEGKEEIKFDWQKDLMDILQPIMSELRSLTEHRRKQENLKARIAFHQNQINTVSEGVNRINEIEEKKLNALARKTYRKIKSNWTKKVEEHQHLMEIAQLQLDEMLRPKEIEEFSITANIKHFLTGRGTTLFLALLAALITFTILKFFQTLFLKIREKRRSRQSRTLTRLLGVLYQIITLVLSILAVFIVFHLRGDQVLQGIAILLLLIVILVLKNSIPKLIGELRLLLNVGLVREGERIIYNGLPWLVERLNFNTSLVNPAIVGGRIQVPIQMLVDLHSRKSHSEEPWFPCRMGDTVILDDGVYGRVKVISMEGVVMRLAGEALKSYGIGDFLGQNPVNLSSGFSIAILFGIDYRYQARATRDIPQLFESGVLDGLKQVETYGQHLLSLSCEFNDAAASSLNYKIMATFAGEAASSYYPITRKMNQLAVEVCNRHQLDIPFNQLTIHQAPGS